MSEQPDLPAAVSGAAPDLPQRGNPSERGALLGSAGSAEGTLVSQDECSAREAALRELVDMMRPAVQADGGDLQLVDFDLITGVVEVQLVGACSSCAISSATLQGGVERILKGRLPWVTEVVGGVDESADPLESAAMGQGGYVPRW